MLRRARGGDKKKKKEKDKNEKIAEEAALAASGILRVEIVGRDCASRSVAIRREENMRYTDVVPPLETAPRHLTPSHLAQVLIQACDKGRLDIAE